MYKSVLLALSLIALSILVSCAPLPGASRLPDASRSSSEAFNVRVDMTPGHAVNQFSPLRSLGAAVDAVEAGGVDEIYTPENLTQMLAAGHGPVSYRLFTELGVQAWHWNPEGSWSDPAGRGYWTGSTTSMTPIRYSGLYRLPHRGFTNDQGTQDDYSRLDDGDPNTYWKSNPYLTSTYTGEPDALHPQWVVVDLGTVTPVNAVQITWANPYATAYEVQYWTGDDAIGNPAGGAWVAFSSGDISNGQGGTVMLSLASSPLSVRFLRIWMTASSGTCDTHGSSDPRNCVGYAISEIGVGILNSDGSFIDHVVHSADSSQTVTYVSSVDPWHEPDTKVTSEEQPGLDLIFTSGLTRGLPTLVPVALLYGTPDDAAAEITYLERKGYPISYVELGEEPEEQHIMPEDYGALYLQWVYALHAVDPALKLGGPVFASEEGDVQTWADSNGSTSWLSRFVNYLRSHGRSADLSFLSFEHYPFGGCNTDWSTLLNEPKMVNATMKRWSSFGLPVFITEYNFSADYSQASVETLGAAWHADFLGSFLTAGGSGAYFYEYEPIALQKQGTCWGSFSMFAADGHHHIKSPAAEFFSSQILNREWVQPVDAVHDVYPATSSVTDVDGNTLMTAYALHRPDGQWALLLVNKDPKREYDVIVTFHNAADRADHSFAGPVTMVTFGVDNYTWHANGPDGYADPDGPPITTTLPGGPSTVYTLPRGSITILRGQVR